MRPTGLIAASGFLVVLGGLVWWTKQNPKKPESTTPDAPKVLALGEDQVEGITIAKSGAEPIVLKKVGDKWQITAPTALPADQDAVKALVTTLSSLQSDRLIDLKPASIAEFGLTEPTESIEVDAKGGVVNKILLGSDNPSGSATYVKLASNPAVYTLLSSTKTNIDKSVTELRDKRLLTFDREKLTGVTVTPAKGAAFDLGRNGTEWAIVKPRPLRADTPAIDDLMRKLGDARMDLAPGNDDEKKNAAEFAGGAQIATVQLRDNSGQQAITVRQAKDNAYFARSTATEGTWKLSGDLGEGLKDKSVDNFRNKKLFDFGFTDPTKLEINGGAYQKSADKWTGPSGQVDPTTVQIVIDKLRDLSAAKFSEKAAAGKADLTLVVTSGEKNKVEKVSAVKVGDTLSAQREGDPEGYILDAKAADELQKAIAGIKPFQPSTPEKKK